MMTTAHLWAVGYDDMSRADEVRDELVQLALKPATSALFILVDAIRLGCYRRTGRSHMRVLLPKVCT
jgi:hypothetical protein